jgi:malonate decarboxylase gamma subunit
VPPEGHPAPSWMHVVQRLFPDGNDVHAHGPLLHGTGRVGERVIAVIGSCGHPEIGVELALAMAERVLSTVRDDPGRALLFLVDTEGQRLRRRDELLGLHRYMAHLAASVALARTCGHAVIALVYDQALSGGFLPTGMMADHCAALPDAEIRVMNLPAMARVTRIPLERLTALAITSPVFAPGAVNYLRMGGLAAIWDGDLASALVAALADVPDHDARREWGHARGGRALAHDVARRVLESPLPEEW